MLDIKFIRENPEIVKENMRKKFKDHKIVDDFLKMDGKYRKDLNDVQKLKARRNELTREIAEKMKKKLDAKSLLKEAKESPEKIKEMDDEIASLKIKMDQLILTIPNIISDDVPIGRDSKENVETAQFGTPKKYDFKPKNHVELVEDLGIVDFEGAARVTGKGFFYLKGDIVLLNQAIIRFALDFMVKKGYTPIEPPLMLDRKHVMAVMPSADFEQHAFKIDGKEQYMIATSEHPLVAWFQDQVIDKKQLPLKLTGFSQCFRQEIGSHGIEEKGLYRTHQFNKVEQVIICEPEDSVKFYKEIRNNSIELYKALELPFRTLESCSGDLGDLKFKGEDLEAWSPVKNEYYEIGSCSNLTDNQARRANIKVFDGQKRYTPHTLNNTAIATSRCMVAIIENNQNKDGSITVPKVLVPYMNGVKVIKRK